MGRNVTLVVKPSDVRAPSVKFRHWKFLISTPRELADDARCEGVREVLADWYKARASVHIPEGVDQWWEQTWQGKQVADTDRRPEAPLGELLFRWHAPL